MDSLQDILSNKSFEEPPEAALIREYVKNAFSLEVGVQVRSKDILIIVPHAALANTLRLRGPDIKRYCQTDKRLSFRIG